MKLDKRKEIFLSKLNYKMEKKISKEVAKHETDIRLKMK